MKNRNAQVPANDSKPKNVVKSSKDQYGIKSRSYTFEPKKLESIIMKANIKNSPFLSNDPNFFFAKNGWEDIIIELKEL